MVKGSKWGIRIKIRRCVSLRSRGVVKRAGEGSVSIFLFNTDLLITAGGISSVVRVAGPSFAIRTQRSMITRRYSISMAIRNSVAHKCYVAGRVSSLRSKKLYRSSTIDSKLPSRWKTSFGRGSELRGTYCE